MSAEKNMQTRVAFILFMSFYFGVAFSEQHHTASPSAGVPFRGPLIEAA